MTLITIIMVDQDDNHNDNVDDCKKDYDNNDDNDDGSCGDGDDDSDGCIGGDKDDDAGKIIIIQTPSASAAKNDRVVNISSFIFTGVSCLHWSTLKVSLQASLIQ